MVVVGLTGGIASGKTTVVKHLKKKRFAIHESDKIVKKIYSKPSIRFVKYLKKIRLEKSLQGQSINKQIIREEIFANNKKRRKLEEYIHAEVKKSRDQFLKIHKQKNAKTIFVDIPLLFENKLENICDYTILLYAPIKIRKNRAMKRKGMKKDILNKIIKSQLSDRLKKLKADFVVNTTTSKNKCFNKLSKIIELITKKQNA